MNRERLYQILPDAIVYGSAAAGFAGFADSIGSFYFKTDLGIRNFLPEPFDLPDHGPSLAMGALLCNSSFQRDEIKSFDTHYPTISDSSAEPVARHHSMSKLRRAVRSVTLGAIIAGSTYVAVGEVGSEIIHYVHDNNQKDKPVEERTNLPIGHLDPLDLLYGVGAAVSVAKLRQRVTNQKLDALELKLPPLPKQPKAQKPATNKRYTPPKQ